MGSDKILRERENHTRAGNEFRIAQKRTTNVRHASACRPPLGTLNVRRYGKYCLSVANLHDKLKACRPPLGTLNVRRYGKYCLSLANLHDKLKHVGHLVQVFSPLLRESTNH
jgi:hypothetical protein